MPHRSTDETLNREIGVARLYQQGHRSRSISRLTGLPRTSVIRIINKFKNGSLDAEQRASCEPVQVNIPKRIQIALEQTSSDCEEQSGNELWNDIETRNKRGIAKMLRGLSQDFDYSSLTEPLLVTCVSDLHLGSLADLESVRKITEYIVSTPNAVIVECGDVVDNFIKPSHQSVSLDYPMTIEQQWKLYHHWIDLTGDRLIASIGGNHDAWTQRMSGVDFKKHMLAAYKPGSKYNPDQMLLKFQVGSFQYKIQLMHSFRVKSMYNPAHEAMQAMRFGTLDPDIDGMCLGDKHEAYLHHARCIHKYVWFVRPGTAKPYDPYSRMLGFLPCQFTTPTFVLFPKERFMLAFDHFQDAVIYRRGLVG